MPKKVTGLWTWGTMMILDGTKLILDDHRNNLDSIRSSLESSRSFRGPLPHKPVTGQELFFVVSYSKPALDKTCNCNVYALSLLEQMLHILRYV